MNFLTSLGGPVPPCHSFFTAPDFPVEDDAVGHFFALCPFGLVQPSALQTWRLRQSAAEKLQTPLLKLRQT